MDLAERIPVAQSAPQECTKAAPQISTSPPPPRPNPSNRLRCRDKRGQRPNEGARLGTELWFFGASLGLLDGRFAPQLSRFGHIRLYCLPAREKSPLHWVVGIEHIISERLPGCGRCRVLRIRHIRGGMLALG